MLFNSFEFLLFFPTVCALYFATRVQRKRLYLLFLASCVFYGFFIPAYLLILFLVIGIDFYAGKKIEESTDPKRKKLYLGLSLAANLAILFFFKYANFFSTNVNELAHLLGWNLGLPLLKFILPIGLSFHTFQSLSYIFEVYYGRYHAERDWLTYSVYVLYFPQLVAGPIERPQNMLPQFKHAAPFDYERCVSGMYLMAQGFFKKAVVADSLAIPANTIFEYATRTDASPAGLAATALGVLAFTFQIYCDFSGYSDIARGTSRILGIELLKNFNQPYFATSISDFWRRWHISLSTWFRDYLYIPLGGNRRGKTRTAINLLTVFAVSGLWHGANWTYIVWGSLHGIYLILETRIFKKALPRILVFVLVAISWVFFRAANLGTAFRVLKSLTLPSLAGLGMLPRFQIEESLILVLCVLTFELVDQKVHFWGWIRRQTVLKRWTFYTLALIIFLFSAQFSGTQFIYFQF